jgi:hypothetical protein
LNQNLLELRQQQLITQINNQLKPEELDEVVRTDVMKLLDRIEKSANSFLFM